MTHSRLAKENVLWVARLTGDQDERLQHLEEMVHRHLHERIYETRAESTSESHREYTHYVRVLQRYRALLEARDPPGLAAVRAAFCKAVFRIGYKATADYLSRINRALDEVCTLAQASTIADRRKIERWRKDITLSPELMAQALSKGEGGRQAAERFRARLERLYSFVYPEAIAEILIEEDYLFRIRRNLDFEAWDPFLKEMLNDLCNLRLYADSTHEVLEQLSDLVSHVRRSR